MSPAGRGNRILGTVLITPFVLGGLAAVIVGITFIGGEGKDLDFGYVLVASGGIMMLIFGAALVSYRCSLQSPGLRLTTEGFDLPKHSFAWSDVDDFQFVHGGEGMGDHLRSGIFAVLGTFLCGAGLTGGEPLIQMLSVRRA